MRVGAGIKLLIISGTVLSIIGCAGSGSKKYQPMQTALIEEEPVPIVETAAIEDVSQFYGEPITLEDEEDLLTKHTVYFDYDKYEVKAEHRKIILAHARRLSENPKLRLRIGGHADERGSRAYNVALGEKRAKAVAKILALKGIPADQVVSVSYGKEQPIDFDHNEAAWSKNRRAELYYEEAD